MVKITKTTKKERMQMVVVEKQCLPCLGSGKDPYYVWEPGVSDDCLNCYGDGVLDISYVDSPPLTSCPNLNEIVGTPLTVSSR